MSLNIDTFSNVKGGSSFFKAVGHPLAAGAARDWIAELERIGLVAIYDPMGLADAFAELIDLSRIEIAGVFVQDLADLDRVSLNHRVQPVTALPDCDAAAVLVIAFDAERLIAHIRHLLPARAEAVSLDAMRLPDDMLTNRRRYLDPLNFATNFAFFRDGGGHHTRLVTANYWSGYGARSVTLWLSLLGEDGSVLATWREELPRGTAGIVIDSREVRDRFGLGPFTGQLFFHVIGAAGHDIVKYALDTYGEANTVLSCTHDANAWPADFYAGLPAPQAGERVILWVQNSHPCPVPAGEIGLNLMGRDEIAWLEHEIPPYGTHALATSELLPDAAWPEQIEVRAGKYFVRPRYEVVAADGRRRIAHANVERIDLTPDPRIAELSNLLGKSYVLPAPVLPLERWRCWALPTPMATSQADLPLALLIYDPAGREVAVHRLGRLARDKIPAVAIDEILDGNGGLHDGFGHMELVYDFAEGGGADGWLHGLFRYEDRTTGHIAETSFGGHIFNTVLTYRNEPQSYAGPAPGLSTRLFLRVGPPPLDTFCHLIYPASTPWHAASETDLILHDGDGREVERRRVEVPCSGSLLWRYSELFGEGARARAGDRAYIIIRDTTCRLFGYHGLMNDAGAFSLDHMFGF